MLKIQPLLMSIILQPDTLSQWESVVRRLNCIIIVYNRPWAKVGIVSHNNLP